MQFSNGMICGLMLVASNVFMTFAWYAHLKNLSAQPWWIAALASWKTSPEFDDKEKAALAIAEAVTQGAVSDEVYREAMRHFDHHDYVELAVTAAFYAMVARTLDALGIQLEPDFRDYSPKLP